MPQRRTTLHVLWFVLAGGLGVSRAHAQACCTTSGAQDLGTLGPAEQQTVGAQLGYDHAYGSVDSAARFQALSAASAMDWVMTLGAGARLWPSALQVLGTLPLRYQHRKLSGTPADNFVGLGDASLGLRYEFVSVSHHPPTLARPGSFIPGVTLLGGVRFNTGRGPSEARRPTMVDATGDGSTMARLGLALVQPIAHDDFVHLSAAYGYHFARQLDTPGGRERFEPGAEILISASVAHRFSVFWSAEVMTTFQQRGEASYDGSVEKNSGSYRTRLGVGVSHYLSYPQWQLMLTALADPPFDSFARNLPFAGSSLALSIRRNFTR